MKDRLTKVLVNKLNVHPTDNWLRRRNQVLELRKEQKKIKKRILKEIERDERWFLNVRNVDTKIDREMLTKTLNDSGRPIRKK
jgi:hypothetical protein